MKQSSITVVDYESLPDLSFLELSMNIPKTSFIYIQTKITFFNAHTVVLQTVSYCFRDVKTFNINFIYSKQVILKYKGCRNPT